MRRNGFRLCLGSALLCAAFLLAACGTRGPRPGLASTPGDAVQMAGLPDLPAGADDPAQARTVSLADNIQTGSQAVLSSPNAVFVNGSGLDMGPAGASKNGWAVWRWGEFQHGNLPRELHTSCLLTGGNEYWVLVANYSRQRWQVLGPVRTASCDFVFDAGDSYLSPAANAYVAILVTGSHRLQMTTLNLVADSDADPPAGPTGLTVTDITQKSALLNWVKPADPDLNHYEIYSGPADGFALTDPGVSLLAGNVPKTAQQYPLTGLLPETQYFIRLRALDAAGNESPLTETVSFTTKVNEVPIINFAYYPGNVQKDTPILFDSGPTEDRDDAPEVLVCRWDWENDGVDDVTVTGLGLVSHTFNFDGVANVKLTVSDGFATVSMVQHIGIGLDVDTRVIGYAQGNDTTRLICAAFDYATRRSAVILYADQALQLATFDGAAWEFSDLSTLGTNEEPRDVGFGPAGLIYLLTTRQDDALLLHWSIYSFDGNLLERPYTGIVPAVEIGGQPHPQHLYGGAKLATGPNGRFTIAIATSEKAAVLGGRLDFFLSTIHQTASGAYQVGVNWEGQEAPTPFGVRRTDDTSYTVLTQKDSPALQLTTVTDATITTAAEQAFGGAPRQLICDQDPAAGSHVSWVLLADQFYYGDNFGTPNGPGQTYAAADAARLLGVRGAGDNQSEFCWTTFDATDTTALRGTDTNSGTLYDFGAGVGLCDVGYAGSFNLGGPDGLYLIAAETRDGEINGYFLHNGTISPPQNIALPAAQGSVGLKALAFRTNTGEIAVLDEQPYPTTLLHLAPALGTSFSTTQLGVDTWARPDCGAPGTLPGELLLGSQYGYSDLILNRFAAGDPQGSYQLTLKDVALPRMAYNPVLNRTLLAYATGGGKSIGTRSWDGAGWSPLQSIYAGSSDIVDLVLRVRPDGEWGIAWDDLACNVMLAETQAGVWQPPVTLSTAVLDQGFGSVGFEYASNGDAGLSVERQGAAPGLYFGTKPAGSPTASWALVTASDGHSLSSMNVQFRFGTDPVVLYYDVRTGMAMGSYSGGWSAYNLPFYLKGNPVATLIDAAATIEVFGKDNSTGQSAVGLVYP